MIRRLIATYLGKRDEPQQRTVADTLRPDPDYRERRLRAFTGDRRKRFEQVVREFAR